MWSQIKPIAVATNMQVPVFLFSQQEDGSKKRIYYEPKSIAEIKLDFYPKLGLFKEVNILNRFEWKYASQNQN